ncbi:MAG: SDR family NAD(P)-dependent oxidoreductase, partial [Candidatus Hydrogenedentes bacterium]|nr:SDR family NAD(P)-dependent oxidoreductase [Candidatus Hydrogenedentota bacterium]
MSKKIIITGASKGIGKGIATFLAMDGASVGLLARSKDLLEDLRQSIEEQGGACFTAACDLRDADETAYAINAVIEGLGGVDALVNNAGLVIRKSIFDIELDEWRA